MERGWRVDGTERKSQGRWSSVNNTTLIFKTVRMKPQTLNTSLKVFTVMLEMKIKGT